MKASQVKAYVKYVQIGFWKRLIICSILVASITLFTAFNIPLVKLFSSIVMLVSAELFIYCYYPLFASQIRFTFRNKGIEQPLPNELAILSRKMKLRIDGMKVIPNLCNAYVWGKQFFMGDELLRKLSMEQIKAVGAHEFWHIKEKHRFIQIIYILPIMICLYFSWYNMNPIIIDLGLFAYMMIALAPIQWWFEKRADHAAVRYVGKDAIKTALLALEDNQNLDEPSETHPPTNLRLKWIDESEN
ncbi:MAG: M48 family metalloprotease [Candidatus Methanomethylicaceae archaeon]|jgi:Zn-dependent protease with chaperone function